MLNIIYTKLYLYTLHPHNTCRDLTARPIPKNIITQTKPQKKNKKEKEVKTKKSKRTITKTTPKENTKKKSLADQPYYTNPSISALFEKTRFLAKNVNGFLYTQIIQNAERPYPEGFFTTITRPSSVTFGPSFYPARTHTINTNQVTKHQNALTNPTHPPQPQAKDTLPTTLQTQTKPSY